MPFLNQRKGENDRRNYFMVNYHDSMWPDRGSNQRRLDSQSDSLPTALGGPALIYCKLLLFKDVFPKNCEFDNITRFLQNLHRWKWALCSYIDPCAGYLHFLRGMNLQFSAVTMRMHFFTF